MLPIVQILPQSLALLALLAPGKPPKFAAGHVFVSGATSDNVVEFARDGTDLGARLIDLPGAVDLKFGADGLLYVLVNGTPFSSPGILGFDAGGGLQRAVPLANDGAALTIGPGGRFYVPVPALARVEVYGATDTLEAFIPAAGTPSDLQISPYGRFLISLQTANVLRFTDSQGFTLYNTGAGLVLPTRLCFWPGDGSYWAMDSSGDMNFFQADGTPQSGSDIHPPVGQPFFDVTTSPDEDVFYATSASGGGVVQIIPAPPPIFTSPLLGTPTGVEIAPWRFKVTVKGTLSQLAGKVVGVKETATLAVSPISGRATLAFKKGGKLDKVFLGQSLVCQGLESGIVSSSTHTIHATQRPDASFLVAQASLDLDLATKVDAQFITSVKSVKGTLCASSGLGVFTGSVKSTKSLN